MPFEDVDVAYLAGLYEGEGSVRVDGLYSARNGERRVRRTPQVKLRIAMTDREPLERVQRVFGGRINGPYQDKRKPEYKPLWVLDIDSPPLVREVVDAIYPMLSPRRQDQLDVALGREQEVV